VGRRDTSVESVLFGKEERSYEWKGRQRVWPCHKRHSKRSGRGVQCMPYDKGHRSTVERAFQTRYAC